MPETPQRVRYRWGQRLARSIGYAFALTLPVAAIAAVIRSKWTPVLDFDEAAIRAGTDFVRARPELRTALVAWQEVFQPRWVYADGALACLYAWRRHQLPGRALWAFLTMMVSWNLALDVKLLVQRARPVVEDAVARAPGFSFPSGHAANTAAATTAVVILLWPIVGETGRRIAIVTGAAMVLVTGVDRVMLGVHYPSDVIGGFLLGTGLVLASYLGWRPR